MAEKKSLLFCECRNTVDNDTEKFQIGNFSFFYLVQNTFSLKVNYAWSGPSGIFKKYSTLLGEVHMGGVNYNYLPKFLIQIKIKSNILWSQ